ncbi:MAG: hypothetical protein KA885_11760 [Spirochaetes bacterium]|nr:hypothetical protein [Spirochaetota bacterium]
MSKTFSISEKIKSICAESPDFAIPTELEGISDGEFINLAAKYFKKLSGSDKFNVERIGEEQISAFARGMMSANNSDLGVELGSLSGMDYNPPEVFEDYLLTAGFISLFDSIYPENAIAEDYLKKNFMKYLKK